jgi:hypothetical protein
VWDEASFDLVVVQLFETVQDAAKAVLSTKSTAYYETGALDHVSECHCDVDYRDSQ